MSKGNKKTPIWLTLKCRAMSKFKVTFLIICRLYSRCRRNFTSGMFVNLQFIPFLKAIRDFNPFVDKPEDKFLKYWLNQSVPEIIIEADRLYLERKYLEVYELLNRLKFSNNVEVQWRIGRALYKLSFDKNVKKSVQREMIQEAFDLLKSTLSAGEENANIHKWYALVLDRFNAMQGIEYRLRNSEIVKLHLSRACELNPGDITVHYMLGRWCYEMTHLSKLQRFITRILYVEPPTSTYEEAFKYLLRAEELKPGKFLQNTFILGQTCVKLGEFYRAQYYLNLVSNLQPKNDYEKQCVHKARRQSKRLKKYELGKEVLFFDFPFGLGDWRRASD